MVKNNEKTLKYIEWGVFFLLLCFISTVTYTLFMKQVYGGGGSGIYESDMAAYILEMQGKDSGFSFPYPIYFKISAFFNLFMIPERAVSVAAMLLNSLAVVFTKLELDKVVKKSKYSGILISFVSVALFFVSMLHTFDLVYIPGIFWKYLGVFTSNPYHNATFLAARPFAVLAYFKFCSLLSVYETQKPKWQDYALFSLYLLLSTMTKPSFTIVIVATAGLVMLYRLIAKRFKNFVPTLLLGLCFIPTFIDLLYQYSGVFVPTAEEEIRGIGFSLGRVWGKYCENIPMAVFLAIGFPIVVLLFNLKKIKTDDHFRFSFQMYGMSFLMAYFLLEKGFRERDFNFSWSYMYGIFFAFVGSVKVMLDNLSEFMETDASERKAVDYLRLIFGGGAFLAHLLCGAVYFYHVFMGGNYK
ncbi:MAG: hypothetical protein J6033_03060 [Lachnospiraceae bacterium]|nr:hypothetical protein [Lachnospiraceae bacterium]